MEKVKDLRWKKGMSASELVEKLAIWGVKLIVMAKTVKKVFRSAKNKMVMGVLGGVGEYFDVDPNLVRLIYVLLTAFTGFAPGIIAYIIAAIIVPEKKT